MTRLQADVERGGSRYIFRETDAAIERAVRAHEHQGLDVTGRRASRQALLEDLRRK
jgi:hypothetical protein